MRLGDFSVVPDPVCCPKCSGASETITFTSEGIFCKCGQGHKWESDVPSLRRHHPQPPQDIPSEHAIRPGPGRMRWRR